jgi:uncharacterized protein
MKPIKKGEALMVRKILRVVMWILLAVAVIVGVMAWRNWDTVQRVFLGGLKVYETVPPTDIPANLKRPAILVFSKTNAFRHEDAIPAATKMFNTIAAKNGWGVYHTENGATFSPEILAKFDVVVFSNASGDMFNPAQEDAFKGFLNNGGGYLGIHAAGDNSHADWGWYMTDIIGTTFTGHPMDPQFQKATIRVEDKTNPATAQLPDAWSRTDEWYSFDKSPRKDGVNVLATLDESTYNPGEFFGTTLAMGKDHPIIWSRCVGKGRVFYSALGHTAASFSEPENVQSLTGALEWTMRLKGEGCESFAAP